MTNVTRWTPPEAPQRIELDDEGSYVFTEDEMDRLMPTAGAVIRAGRWDLHRAIVTYGGYRAVREMLARGPSYPRNAAISSSKAALRAAVREAQEEIGIDRRSMPKHLVSAFFFPGSAPERHAQAAATPNWGPQDLLDLGRTDIIRECNRRGGLQAAAQLLGLKISKARNKWEDIRPAAEEVWGYLLSSFGPTVPSDLPCPAAHYYKQEERIS